VSEKLYGLLVEFSDPDRLLEAARKVRAEGYRKAAETVPAMKKRGKQATAETPLDATTDLP
jgi:hypothetical protein